MFTEALVVGGSYLAPQLGPVLTAADLTLGLPELFVTPQLDPVELPLGFVLTPADAGPYAYTLLIPEASPVWDFTDRPDVIGRWAELLAELQPLGITPYGVAALTEAVSRSMPQTFAETLYFAYGLRFDRGFFDLRPGLVLRVEYEAYQIAPGGQETRCPGSSRPASPTTRWPPTRTRAPGPTAWTRSSPGSPGRTASTCRTRRAPPRANCTAAGACSTCSRRPFGCRTRAWSSRGRCCRRPRRARSGLSRTPSCCRRPPSTRWTRPPRTSAGRTRPAAASPRPTCAVARWSARWCGSA
ncbi:hypothetical protein ACFQ0M_40295 [Kitasatospora aburaviensis]